MTADKTPEIQLAPTNRGFLLGKFRDRYDAECSIQESSLVEPCLWLGVDAPRVSGQSRMHLTQEMAGALWPMLKWFAERGDLRDIPMGADKNGWFSDMADLPPIDGTEVDLWVRCLTRDRTLNHTYPRCTWDPHDGWLDQHGHEVDGLITHWRYSHLPPAEFEGEHDDP